MDALNQITEGMTGQEVAGIIYQNDANSLTDYIVSYLHPTEGVNGTNVYTLTTAIAKIPQEIRKEGMTCTFLSINGWGSYKYTGTSINDWSTTSNWILIATEKELSNLATQNSMTQVLGRDRTVSIDFSDSDQSVTISLPSTLLLSYGNVRIIDSATSGGQVITDPMTDNRYKYLIYNLTTSQYELVLQTAQMNNSVLVGWLNQYTKTAVLHCDNYTVNGVSQSFSNYIPKTNISHDLITTDANKVLGADQAAILATQNGFMQCANPGNKVEVKFNTNATEITISLPSGLYVSYGNNRIINAATENGTVITSTSTDSLAKYLVYNFATNSFEIVKYDNQMKNCILLGWIYFGASIRSCTLLCDKYSVDGNMVDNQSLSNISYANFPTTVIQLKKYADGGYINISMTPSIDTEVTITGGYVSSSTEIGTDTTIKIKVGVATNLYFRVVEPYAIIEAKGIYALTCGSHFSNSCISQNIKDFGEGITRIISQFNNNISGNIYDIPRNVNYLMIGSGVFANNTIKGNLSDFPRLITTLEIVSSTSLINGDVADLPRKLEYIYLNNGTGSEIIGNPADLPRGLTQFRLYNLVSGFTGDIADFPRGLTSLILSGTNYNISGNITDLPPNVQALQISGSSTVSGDISELPRGLKSIMFFGNCNLKGSLSDLPTNANAFNLQAIDSANPITGDISEIPNKGIIHFSIIKNFNITFNGDFPISDQVYYFMLQPSEAFPIDSATVDNILIKLAAIAGERTGARTLNLTGACAAPTEASQAAIASLQQKGFTVQTN